MIVGAFVVGFVIGMAINKVTSGYWIDPY